MITRTICIIAKVLKPGDSLITKEVIQTLISLITDDVRKPVDYSIKAKGIITIINVKAKGIIIMK